MALMKCRFCGKYAGSITKGGDWICADCVQMLGGMRHWFQIRNMSTDQIFTALGAEIPVVQSKIANEETMRAKVRVNRNYVIAPKRGNGCATALGSFVLIIMLVIIASVVVQIPENSTETAKLIVTQAPTSDIIEVNTEDFYNKVCNGAFNKYNGKWVELKGTVKFVSDYGDLVGYYLYGKKGQGLVGWVDTNSSEKRIPTGTKVTMLGRLQNFGNNQVELANCVVIKSDM